MVVIIEGSDKEDRSRYWTGSPLPFVGRLSPHQRFPNHRRYVVSNLDCLDHRISSLISRKILTNEGIFLKIRRKTLDKIKRLHYTISVNKKEAI